MWRFLSQQETASPETHYCEHLFTDWGEVQSGDFVTMEPPREKHKKVWGPAGDRGSIDFWPGDDVVDYISIAIYGLPDKNITDPVPQERFRDILSVNPEE